MGVHLQDDLLACADREIFGPISSARAAEADLMQYRSPGRTGFQVSTVSFGAWAIGGTCGKRRRHGVAARAPRRPRRGELLRHGGRVRRRSRERLPAKLRSERKEPFVIATKAGRRLPEQSASGYTRENLTSFVERSPQNLEVDAIDLLQLHCPPTDVYYRPEAFGYPDELVQAGKLRFYGVSVERVEEALKAIEYPNVQSVQIIFNVLRQRPSELFFAREGAEGRVSSPACRSPPASSRESSRSILASRRTITALSIARVRPSIVARPSRASTTSSGSRSSRS